MDNNDKSEAVAMDEILRKFAGVLVSRGSIPDAVRTVELANSLSDYSKATLLTTIKDALK